MPNLQVLLKKEDLLPHHLHALFRFRHRDALLGDNALQLRMLLLKHRNLCLSKIMRLF